MEENAFELWKKQKQEERIKKYKEQQEIREMMEKYWPWEHERTKPRGKSNLFMEEIFPVEEFGKVKRVTEIPEVVRHKQLGRKQSFYGSRDPGSKDTTSPSSSRSKISEINKKNIDDFTVEGKENNQILNNLKNPRNKTGRGSNWTENIGLNFLKSLGWSDNGILKKIAKENTGFKIEGFNRKLDGANPKLQAIREYSKNMHDHSSCSQVASDGIELVRVLAKNRSLPNKISLSSTDVTKILENRVESDSDYFQKLQSQVDERKQKLKTSILEDFEKSKEHFNTWDTFWGRPGHGAPLTERKKVRLDNLLYPNPKKSTK